MADDRATCRVQGDVGQVFAAVGEEGGLFSRAGVDLSCRRWARVDLTARAATAAADERAFSSDAAKRGDLKKPRGVEEYCRLLMEEGQGGEG